MVGSNVASGSGQTGDFRVTSHRRRSLAVSVVLAVLPGSGAVACSSNPPPAADPTPTTGARARPSNAPPPDGGVEQPSPSTSTYTATIPGTSIAALTAWWSGRWKVPFPQDGINFSATVERYGDQGRYTIGAIQANDNRTDQPGVVACSFVRSDPPPDSAALHKMVDTCLAPALQGAEQQDVPAWLYEQDVPAGQTRTKVYDRFLVVYQNTDDAMAIRLLGDKAAKVG